MVDSFDAKAEQLCNVILKTDAEFWEKRNQAVLQLTALLTQLESQNTSTSQEIFSTNFYRLIKEPVKIMIADLRSQQVRDICQFLVKLTQISSGEKFRIFMRDMFGSILDGIKVPNKVMSGYVDECIIQLIKRATFKSCVPVLVQEIKDNKAKQVRERCLV
jgi:hypothetical protein